MLARVRVLAMAVSVRLSVSVTSRCFIERDKWIDVVFGTEVSFNQPLRCVLRKFRYLQK